MQLRSFVRTLLFLFVVAGCVALLQGGESRRALAQGGDVVEPAGDAFGLTLEWQRCPSAYCETGWYASPAVADLNEDGTPEVYWGGYSLLAVNGDSGALQWSVPNQGGRFWPGMVAADLEGDGTVEIVVANGEGEVHVYTEGLVEKLGFPVTPFSTDREIRSLAVADLDADGSMEIILCSTQGDSQWTVLEHNGTQRAGWPRIANDGDAEGYAHGCYNQNVGVADLDGDGRGEIVGPNDTHYVAAFEDNGASMLAHAMYSETGAPRKPWSRVGMHVSHEVDLRGYANCGTEHRPNMANSAPAIADLNGDGTLEVVIIGNVYDCTDPYENLYEIPFVLNADRTRWKADGFDWTVVPAADSDAAPLSEDYNRIESNAPNPVIADLDGDGFMEILYPSYDGRLHAYSLGKAEHGNWPYNLQPAGGEYLRFATEPVVADLDNDGFAEVLVATWTENGSGAPGQLLVLSHTGDLLNSIDLPYDAEDERGGALGAPTLANLDGDANLEVVVGTINRGLVAYEIAGSAQARILWGTGRGSYQRTGQAPELAQPLQFEFGVDKALAQAGDTLVYEAVIRNPASAAQSAHVIVTIPANTTLIASSVSTSAGTWIEDGTFLKWQSPVAGGASANMRFSLAVQDDATSPLALAVDASVEDAEGNTQQRAAVTVLNGLPVHLPSIRR